MKQAEAHYINDFLKNHNTAVISTVNSKGTPDGATIYYTSKKNFEIYFVTPNNSQKAKNIKFNKEVVLTISDEDQKATMQLRGKAYQTKNLSTFLIFEIAEKLSRRSNEIKILPFLKHTNEDKIAVKVKPNEICLRQYDENGLAEKLIKLS